MRPTLAHNSAQCRKCKDILVSTTPLNMLFCSCKAVGVGGGLKYIQRSGDAQDILELSKWSFPAGTLKPLPLRMDEIQELIAELVSVLTAQSSYNVTTHYHSASEACITCDRCGSCMTELAKMGDTTGLCTACISKRGVVIL